jgi:iron-sulfur cluster insertion protein
MNTFVDASVDPTPELTPQATARTNFELYFTDAAQERILDLRDNMHKPAQLRIYVQGGGCSGFEYKIDMAQEFGDDDIQVKINPYIEVYIDPFSAPYLEGTTVDYETNSMGSRFAFKNPQAKSTCGCGSSFSIE